MDNSQLKLLQKPLPLKWRVRSAYPNKVNPTHVVLVGYIDSRQVQDLLDEVVGAANWQDEYFECKNKQFCRIGIKINDEWIWKGDSGAETSTEAGKGETSDAFKRAAVKWGINRTAYKVGEVKLLCKMYESRPYPVDDSGRFLKGEALYLECNRLAKTEDFEIEFDKSFDSMAQIAEAAKANKTSKRITKPKVIKP